MLKWGLTSAGRGAGSTEKRVWANHEEEQLCQTLLWKQVAPKQQNCLQMVVFSTPIWAQLGDFQVGGSQMVHPRGLGCPGPGHPGGRGQPSSWPMAHCLRGWGPE